MDNIKVLDSFIKIKHLIRGEIIILPIPNSPQFKVGENTFGLYLTTTDSRTEEYCRLVENNKNPSYERFIKHVRRKDNNKAVMTKEKLWEVIQNNDFIIG